MAFDMMGTSLKNGVYICVYMHSCLCVFLCTSMTQGYQCVCVPPSIAILWGNIPYFYLLREPQRIEMKDQVTADKVMNQESGLIDCLS